MISCIHFIPAYSELFTFLDRKGGKEAVVRFWEYLSDTYLVNLKTLAETQGLRGCWEYWSRALNEEAADFTMELDEDAGVFCIHMHHCPSMGRLLEIDTITPYPDYCEHCATLYSRVLEPLGFSYEQDISNCHNATCSVRVTRREAQAVPEAPAPTS